LTDPGKSMTIFVAESDKKKKHMGEKKFKLKGPEEKGN